jgi:PadR family transcriptional regulator, regulatory protein AphA
VRTSLDRTTHVLTTTEAAILGSLAEGELSGYDLRRVIERSVGYFWRPARSQIYAVLPRLVERGLAGRRDVAQVTRSDKQLYRITPSGRAALRTWVDTAPLEPEPERILLLKLFFGAQADREALLGFVRERREAAEQLAREVRALHAHAKDDPHDRFHAFTRRYGLEVSAAIARWARFVEMELE